MRISDLDSIESLRQGTIYPLGIFLLLLVLTIYSTIRVTAKVIANWTSRHSAGPPSFGLDFATLLFALWYVAH